MLDDTPPLLPILMIIPFGAFAVVTMDAVVGRSQALGTAGVLLVSGACALWLVLRRRRRRDVLR